MFQGDKALIKGAQDQRKLERAEILGRLDHSVCYLSVRNVAERATRSDSYVRAAVRSGELLMVVEWPRILIHPDVANVWIENDRRKRAKAA